MKISINKIFWMVLAASIMQFACVKDRNFDPPQSNCNIELVANTTYSEVKEMYTGDTFQIQEDLIIEGYVISSDAAGNFFSVLHFQDKPQNPSEGFQIEIDQRDSHLFYPVGSKIYIKLKGLYLGKSKDVFKIGGVFTSFGNVSVGRLPTTVVNQHVILSCNQKVEIQATPVSITNLSKNLTNTLVQLSAVEFVTEDQDEIFALAQEETERTLTDCLGNTLLLLNSGFSDFQDQNLPKGNGTIMGVLKQDKNDYQLVIRGLGDIDFDNQRCTENTVLTTSNSIFISELADPENNPGARFVELYNAELETLSLNGWKLLRFTNANTDVNSEIDLSGFVVKGENTLVIAVNGVEFENIYGFAPDVEAGVNTAADSNGDDNLRLVDPFGEIIDVFGVVGEDGSGTNHEFEDGRAVRKLEIRRAKSVFTFSEWQIYNDTGAEGTINEPQIAPDDFTPGVRY